MKNLKRFIFIMHFGLIYYFGKKIYYYEKRTNFSLIIISIGLTLTLKSLKSNIHSLDTLI
jgi:hypothetical protein